MGWATLSAATDRVARARLGGVSVTAGAVSFSGGIFNKGGELALDDRRSINVYELNVPTVLFGSLLHGDPITVDGESYEVRYEPQKIGGGENCLLFLTKLEGAAAVSRLITQSGLALITQDGRYLVTQ